MTYIPIWEEFEKSAEMLYLRDPLNTRYSVKYSHSKGACLVKITDNKKFMMKENIQYACFDNLRIFQRFLKVSENYQPMLTLRGGSLMKAGMCTTKCLQYKTEVQQDVRKIDKFISNLIRHMASNDN